MGLRNIDKETLKQSSVYLTASFKGCHVFNNLLFGKLLQNLLSLKISGIFLLLSTGTIITAYIIVDVITTTVTITTAITSTI